MSGRSISSFIRWRILRRFHPLVRIGWNATRTSNNQTQTIVGFALMFVGWQVKRSSGTVKLYSYTAKPGESVRIRVMHGSTALADATLEV